MRLAVLILAGLVLSTIGVVAFALHDPPDSPDHIARECRFIATLEARRMKPWIDYGPHPFETWRAEDRTGGSPKPGRWMRGGRLPWQATLLWRMTPQTQAPIDCRQALDAARIPKVMKYNEGPSVQVDHLRYSRVTFFPGGDYALARVSLCGSEPNGWDQRSHIWIWRRTGPTWEPITGHITTLLYEYPRFQPPMRCYPTPDN